MPHGITSQSQYCLELFWDKSSKFNLIVNIEKTNKHEVKRLMQQFFLFAFKFSFQFFSTLAAWGSTNFNVSFLSVHQTPFWLFQTSNKVTISLFCRFFDVFIAEKLDFLKIWTRFFNEKRVRSLRLGTIAPFDHLKKALRIISFKADATSLVSNYVS